MKKNKNRINLAILILLATFSLASLVSCSTMGGFFSRIFTTEPESQISGDKEMKKFFSNVRPNRGNPDSHYLLGTYYQDRNRHGEAISEFKKVVYIDPQSVKAYNRMGISYDLLGRYDQAIEAYQAALKIDSNLEYVHNNLGYSYLLKGEVDEAIKAFKSAIALNDQKDIYHNNLGLALAKKEQFDLALQEFKAAGDEARAHYNLANQYYDQDRYEEAKEHYQIALEHKPDMISAQKRLEASEALARIAQTQIKVPNPDPLTAKEITDAKQKILAMVEEGYKQPPKEEDKAYREGQIEISNGNGVTRMARVIADYLKENNFKVVRLTNADSFNYKNSQIYYQKGYEGTAAQIDKEIPLSVKQEEVKNFDRPHIKVKLLIGKDVIPYKKNFSRNQTS